MNPESALTRAVTCAGDCKHEREVKLVTSEVVKLRETVARLEGGISKGEMVYLEVIIAQVKVGRYGFISAEVYRHIWLYA